MSAMTPSIARPEIRVRRGARGFSCKRVRGRSSLSARGTVVQALSLLASLLVAARSSPLRAQTPPPLLLVDSTFDTLTTSIYKVDPETGVMILRGELGTQFTPVFGLAASSEREMYLTASDNTPANACGGALACLLVRVVLHPVSTTPSMIQRIGPIRYQGALVTGIT